MTVSAEPSASSTAARPRGALPDFFIVGHAKCGTTALYEMLRSHPQIFMPDLKEPLYFATDLRLRFQRRGRGAAADRRSRNTSPLFARRRAPSSASARRRPLPLVSPTAAAQIAARASRRRRSSRSCASRRASCARCTCSCCRTTSRPRRICAQALALEPQRRQGRSIPRRSHRPQALLYSEHVRYVEQLRRYHAVFPREQLLVLIYDDFRADNEATVRQVLRFLEVDDTRRGGGRRRPTRPSGCARSSSTNSSTPCRSGAGPATRAAKATVKAVTPRAAAPPGAARGPAAGSSWASRSRPTRADGRAAPPLQGRGGGAQRVHGPRPGGLWGYETID